MLTRGQEDATNSENTNTGGSVVRRVPGANGMLEATRAPENNVMGRGQEGASISEGSRSSKGARSSEGARKQWDARGQEDARDQKGTRI